VPEHQCDGLHRNEPCLLQKIEKTCKASQKLWPKTGGNRSRLRVFLGPYGWRSPRHHQLLPGMPLNGPTTREVIQPP
jgi:hypothetical protein